MNKYYHHCRECGREAEQGINEQGGEGVLFCPDHPKEIIETYVLDKPHYHVLMGLRGCYMPNVNEVYKTKKEAQGGALFYAESIRDDGYKVIGNKETGYDIPAQSLVIEINKCSNQDCFLDEDDNYKRVVLGANV